MTTPTDVQLLARRLDRLIRAATAIRRHLPDLHVLATEPAVHDGEPNRATGFESRPPPGADNDFGAARRPAPQQEVSGELALEADHGVFDLAVPELGKKPPET